MTAPDGNTRQASPDLLSPSADTGQRATIPARLARMALCHFVLYYWEASEHFKARGAQSPNTAYKGSRSGFYYETVIKGATSLREMLAAREAFRQHYGTYPMSADEQGVLLRVAAYALRGAPLIGPYLERKVRADDEPMVQADFAFPPDYTPITGDIGVLADRLEHASGRDRVSLRN